MQMFQLQDCRGNGKLQEKLTRVGDNLEDASAQWRHLISLNKRLNEDSAVTRFATVISLVYASAGAVAVSVDPTYG
jgi:hypothetical protein